jgi:hypothetical protein
MTAAFPDCTVATLANATTAELVQRLIRGKDRVPRHLIDECARRGREMVEHLATLLDKDYYWQEDLSAGEWWLLHHGVMILGLIPSEPAGTLLVGFLRRIGEVEDDALQDLLAGSWPAFFRNKPETVVHHIRALAEDRNQDEFIRIEAINAAIACAARPDSMWPLDEALDWVAAMAFSDDETFDLRVLTGDALLDFARPRHQSGLESLADLQPRDGRFFGRDEIETGVHSGRRST